MTGSSRTRVDATSAPFHCGGHRGTAGRCLDGASLYVVPSGCGVVGVAGSLKPTQSIRVVTSSGLLAVVFLVVTRYLSGRETVKISGL